MRPYSKNEGRQFCIKFPEMSDIFRFRRFSVRNSASAMKLGTDSVLLGAAMSLESGDRTLLDVGCGTGVIALFAAQRLSELGPADDSGFRITAIGTDAPSVEEASLNFRESEWSAHLQAKLCALQDFRPDERFDCIFSNPPFFEQSLRNPDERESRARHTDTLSYRDLCGFAQEYLSPRGRLSVILPSSTLLQLRRCAASFSLVPFRIVSIRSRAGKPVSRIIAEFTREGAVGMKPLVEEEMTVEPNQLTQKYYL